MHTAQGHALEAWREPEVESREGFRKTKRASLTSERDTRGLCAEETLWPEEHNV